MRLRFQKHPPTPFVRVLTLVCLNMSYSPNALNISLRTGDPFSLLVRFPDPDNLQFILAVSKDVYFIRTAMYVNIIKSFGRHCSGAK